MKGIVKSQKDLKERYKSIYKLFERDKECEILQSDPDLISVRKDENFVTVIYIMDRDFYVFNYINLRTKEKESFNLANVEDCIRYIVSKII